MSETKTVWHPYPKEKPPTIDTTYFVTIEVPFLGVNFRFVVMDIWTDSDNGNDWKGYGKVPDNRVIAWAESLEPYNPEGKE